MLGHDPVLIMFVGNPANNPNNTAPETINITLGLVNGSAAPGRIKLAVLDNGAGSTINKFFTPGSTVQGHARATGAMSMGAAFWADTPACGVTPAQPESFSSAGGDPTLFDANGNLLAHTPVPAEARPGRPRRWQRYLPRLQDYGHRGHGLPAMREQPQPSELLRHLRGHAARRGRRGPDVAGQSGRHRRAGLQRAQEQRRPDDRLAGRSGRRGLHPGAVGARDAPAGSADAHPGGRLDRARAVHDAHVVLDQHDRLHGLGKLERRAGLERQHDRVTRQRREFHLHAGLLRTPPAHRRRPARP